LDIKERNESVDPSDCPLDGLPPRSQLLVLIALIISPVISIPAPAIRVFCLLLKVFQSVDEIAPVVPDEARESESCCPESESPFAVPRVTAAWDAAWRAAICPDIVFTVLEIVVTVQERAVTVLVSVFSDPEMVEKFDATVPESELRVVLVVARLVLVVEIAPERVL
jgi:hypothetical protein